MLFAIVDDEIDVFLQQKLLLRLRLVGHCVV